MNINGHKTDHLVQIKSVDHNMSSASYQVMVTILNCILVQFKLLRKLITHRRDTKILYKIKLNSLN